MSEIFHVTEEHIKLMKRLHIGWCDDEYGAPEVDHKRPYGNSDVEEDMKTILNLSSNKCPHCEEVLDDSDDEKANNLVASLHKDMQTVLQILVQNNGIKIGVYKNKEKYGNDWGFVE